MKADALAFILLDKNSRRGTGTGGGGSRGTCHPNSDWGGQL